MICEICGLEIVNPKGVGSHLKYEHDMNAEQYYLQFMGDAGKCLTCGGTVAFYGLTSGYGAYCSVGCMSRDPKIRKQIKETNIAKYGSANHFSKIKESNLQRYGATMFLATKEGQQKAEETFKAKYGVKRPAQNKTIITKTKQHFIDTFGVDNPSLDPSVKEKKAKTTRAHYGVATPFESLELREKALATKEKLYGNRNYNNREQFAKTNLAKYGVPHYMQNIDFFASFPYYAYGDFTLPSGRVIKIQGYEDIGLNLLLKKFTEAEITTGRKEIPSFTYSWENKTKKYFPDFYISKHNLILDVKSIWTYESSKEINLLKRQSVIDNNYDFAFIVIDKRDGSFVITDYNNKVILEELHV